MLVGPHVNDMEAVRPAEDQDALNMGKIFEGLRFPILRDSL